MTTTTTSRGGFIKCWHCSNAPAKTLTQATELEQRVNQAIQAAGAQAGRAHCR
jgi:hypothetical protein